MNPYTTLIIDDEQLARERLKKLLAGFQKTFTIIGEAKNGNEAERLIHELEPDLLFLDIEMPGQTGFELLSKLKRIPIVIFCTAYEDYSLKAFDTNSVDYLVKPVKLERLQKTVDKLSSLKNNLASSNLLQAIQDISDKKQVRKMTSITIKKRDKIIFEKLENVSHFEAEDKYVIVHTEKGEEIIEQSLTKLENKLPDYFIQVHRSYIINTHFIKEFQKYFNSRYLITLKNPQRTTITSGRSYNESLKKWMEI
ncbi:MAG: response regulator transcription factor [Flavobacteriaceae bacterium]|nr:response regulator transcription factor [Flavobacteriaceae bacterium]